MKFIREQAEDIKGEIQEELHESSGKTVKNYYLSGIFSTPDKKNRNGRIYPMSIWEKEVKNYQKEIKENTINTLGEIDHPSRTHVDPLNAAIKILELKIENGKVIGKAKILNNNSPQTNQLKALIDEGMKIGVSSRGVGTVKNGIVEEFKLVTYDCVSNPSDYNANLSGMTEGVLEDKEFTLTESGNIEEVQMCSKDSCTMFKPEEIQKATKSKFKDILGSLDVSINEAKKAKPINTEIKIKIKAKGEFAEDNEVFYRFDVEDIEKQINDEIYKIVEKSTSKKVEDSDSFRIINIARYFYLK